MKCQNCNQRRDFEDNFCGHCGNKLPEVLGNPILGMILKTLRNLFVEQTGIVAISMQYLVFFIFVAIFSLVSSGVLHIGLAAILLIIIVFSVSLLFS